MASQHRANFPRTPTANAGAIVGGATKGAKYRFTVLTAGVVRYEYAHDGTFEDRASTFAIHRKQPVPKYRVVEAGDSHLEISTERFRLTYDKKPFSTNGLSIEMLGGSVNWGGVWRYGQVISDLGGTTRTLDNADGRVPLMPGILSRNGFAVLDDSESMLFEDSGWVGMRKPGERVDGYFFSYGNDYREALKAFYEISGKPPLLPRWALGNWWSRYHKYSDREYLELMDRFKEEGIPLSVAVLDMDWHRRDIDPKYGSGWTGYSWNRELFPDPRAFTNEIKKRDLKVTLNDHQADGVHAFEDSYKKMAKALSHDFSNEDPIAFDVTNQKFMDAYFDILHRDLEDDGVDFWWIDWQQGSFSKHAGIDPLWVLNHYHFIDNARCGKRPLTFSRYAGPGSHRYPVGFSGDTIVSWKSLDFQPEFTATASNVGYGWWSHDIGGHMGGYKNHELATRWVQLGCFSPILRLHSNDNPFNNKEPWSFRYEECKAQIEILRFRHRLVPYLYTMNYLSARDGIPLVQPMYYDHPTIGQWPGDAYSVPNQFKFGSELTVIPITSPADPITGLSSTKGWLPPGRRYVDIFTSMVYDGGRHVKLHRNLSGYPVLAQEGAIIPLDASEVPFNGCDNPTRIELVVVVGADGFFELLEDDGRGGHIDDVKTTKTPISFSQSEGLLTIGPGATEGPSREWKVQFIAYRESPGRCLKVALDGKDVSRTTKSTEKGTEVTVTVAADATLTITLGTSPQLTPADVRKWVYPIVDDAQIEYNMKTRIWDALTGNSHKTVCISKLLAEDMPEGLKEAILECALADTRSDFL